MSGRGKAQKTLDLVGACYIILQEINPATVRAVCYRLFVRGVINSMSKSETSKVSKQLTWAREVGAVPWHWVVDETRAPERIATFSNTDEFLDVARNAYRKDAWSTQANWVEVWSEKGTVRGTLAPVLEEYGVTFRVMHGYGSATALHDIAVETASSEKSLTVLYVGDWDPSGMNMSELDLPERIDRYGGSVNIIRVALSEEDVAEGKELPSFEAETKRCDSRYEWFVDNYGSQCWEVDALPPPELRQRVTCHIICLLDDDAWEHALAVGKAEQDSMASFFDRYRETISRQVPKYSPGPD